MAVIVTCCALWGLNQVVVKVTLSEVPPLTQLAVRCLGAAVLVLAWARLRGVTLFARDGTGRAGLVAGLLFGSAVDNGIVGPVIRTGQVGIRADNSEFDFDDFRVDAA